MNEEKLPFIIGITGHRDLLSLRKQPSEGLEAVKTSFKECLQYWREKLGNATPIWIYSGMAAGADLIASQCAEELIDSNDPKWRNGLLDVFPCLPMPIEHYKIDFRQDPSSLNRLDASLLRFSDNIIIIQSGNSEHQYRQAMEDKDYGDLRSSLYLNCGLFIAKYCNVLVAMWDGLESAGIGGTGDIVAFKCGRSIKWPKVNGSIVDNSALSGESGFDGYMGGIVQHISVIRPKKTENSLITSDELVIHETLFLDSGDEIKQYSCFKHTDELDGESVISRLIHTEHTQLISDLSKFNKALDSNTSLVKGQPEENTDSLPEGLRKGLGKLSKIFAQSDRLAIATQSKYRNKMQLFTLIAFTGLLFYELISNYLGSLLGIGLNVWILLSILFGWALIMNARKTRLKWFYQCFRGVAEAMRVKAYLNLADVAPDSKPLLPRRYRQRFPLINHAARLSELQWWINKSSHLSIQTQDAPKDLDLVENEWLLGQLSFLNNRLSDKTGVPLWRVLSQLKAHIYGKPKLAQTRFAFISSLFFYVALASGLTLLAFQTTHFFTDVLISKDAFYWTMLLIQMSLLVGAAVALWEELANYKMTFQGYEDLVGLYQRAIIVLKSEDLIKNKEMLSELAREAMQEHAQWHHFESQSDLQKR